MKGELEAELFALHFTDGYLQSHKVAAANIAKQFNTPAFNAAAPPHNFKDRLLWSLPEKESMM